jgi:hypothetical protein
MENAEKHQKKKQERKKPKKTERQNGRKERVPRANGCILTLSKCQNVRVM